MQDIQLSPHFKLSELTASATARENGIDNTPPPKIVDNLSHLCEGTLEPLREEIKLPVVITSGYRCKALNERITHHSDSSQHMSGCAADFYVGQSTVSGFKFQVSGLRHRELLIKAFKTIILDERIEFDQLIIYPDFIHVSYVREGRKNRHKLTQGYGNGKYRTLTKEEALALE